MIHEPQISDVLRELNDELERLIRWTKPILVLAVVVLAVALVLLTVRVVEAF